MGSTEKLSSAAVDLLHRPNNGGGRYIRPAGKRAPEACFRDIAIRILAAQRRGGVLEVVTLQYKSKLLAR